MCNVSVFRSSKSLSMSRVSRVHTSIRQRAARGTAGRRTRRRAETRRWPMNNRAWWDESTSLDPVSPPHPRTRPTAMVRHFMFYFMFLFNPSSSITMSGLDNSTATDHIAMKFPSDIHAPQRLIPNDFGGPLKQPLGQKLYLFHKVW